MNFRKVTPDSILYKFYAIEYCLMNLLAGSQLGCFSNIGCNNPSEDMEGSRQVLNLSKRCFKHGTIIHEMLHTLGFVHMQNTYNRDDFVTIVWDNIKPGHGHDFKKRNATVVTDFGVPYDYSSVMHYPAHAFTNNGCRTIIPLQADVEIGQRIGMSEGDVLKLNKMYCEDEEFTPQKVEEGEEVEEVTPQKGDEEIVSLRGFDI